MSNKQKFLNYLLSFGSISVLNYLDVITTIIGLNQGFSEANSFISVVMRNYGTSGLILVKVFIMFILFFVSKSKYTFIILYLEYSTIVLHNFYLIHKSSIVNISLLSTLLLAIFIFILKYNSFFGKNYTNNGVNIPLHTCKICGAGRPHIPKSPGVYKGFAIPFEYQRASDNELCILHYRESINIEGFIPNNNSSNKNEMVHSFSGVTIKNGEGCK